MKNFFTRLFSWFAEEGRSNKLIIGVIISLLFGFATGFVSACIFEYCAWLYNGRIIGLSLWDKEGGWSWNNFLATLLGSSIGGLIHLFLF